MTGLNYDLKFDIEYWNSRSATMDRMAVVGFVPGMLAVIGGIMSLFGAPLLAGGLCTVLSIADCACSLKSEKRHGFAVAGLIMGIVVGNYLTVMLVISSTMAG